MKIKRTKRNVAIVMAINMAVFLACTWIFFYILGTQNLFDGLNSMEELHGLIAVVVSFIIGVLTIIVHISLYDLYEEWFGEDGEIEE